MNGMSLFQRVVQRVVVEGDGNRCGSAAIDDAGGLASNAQAAARSGPLQIACECDDFHVLLQIGRTECCPAVEVPRDQGTKNECCRRRHPV